MKNNKNKGFTLIELMIVVAIVGILASIALPGYQQHIVRSRFVEVINQLDHAKVAVSEYYSSEGTLNNISPGNFEKLLGIDKNINTRLIRDLWIGPYGGHDITIWARIRSGAPVPSGLIGSWPIYLAGDVVGTNKIIWECKSDLYGGIYAKYAPSSCR